MAHKTTYAYRVEPQYVDFTLRATVPALGGQILNTAGVDAHNKGFGVDVLNPRGMSWVLSRFAMEFDSLPAQYTPFDITTWVNECTALLTTRNFTLTDTCGHEFGRSVSQWCLIDIAARRPISLSTIDQFNDDYITAEPSPCDKPHKLTAIEGEELLRHAVAYNDIDFNCHVNTMRYIDLMFDTLPLDMFRGDYRVRLDIHFLRESRYGQTLVVYGCEQDGGHLFEIRTTDGTICCRAAISFVR